MTAAFGSPLSCSPCYFGTAFPKSQQRFYISDDSASLNWKDFMAAFAEPRFSPDGIPSSLHTEVAILGAMLLDAVAISDATAKLRDEDFSLDSHQRIYRAILELLASNHAV